MAKKLPNGTIVDDTSVTTTYEDVRTEWDVTRPTERTEGSIFINNTSFSGADIQVAIHMYPGSTGMDDAIEKLEMELSIAEDAVEKYQSLASSYEGDMSKPGTKEFENAVKDEISARSKLLQAQQVVEALRTRIADTEGSKKGGNTKVLAECQTLSVSIHREKVSVRACGCVYPKGVCRGQREIAGSMIFTVFNEHVLY